MANIERYGLAGLECALLREMRDGRAGGSASRIIGDQSTTDPGGGVGGPRRGQPASMAVAGGAWAWTHLGFEHTCFSATGEPSHGSSWAG